MTLISTQDVVRGLDYLPGKDATLKIGFPELVKAVQQQVLKLEVKQSYAGHGEPGFELEQQGQYQDALDKIPELHEGDVPLYGQMNGRGAEFIRCRFYERPVHPYLAFEMEHYRYTARLGEKIYIGESQRLGDIYRDHAQHDFMVFDTAAAILQDYDETGALRGAWLTRDEAQVFGLIGLYGVIKALSVPLEIFQAREAQALLLTQQKNR